jgi:hypothetical protein
MGDRTGSKKRERMENHQEMTADGLIEGVGQELEPYGPPINAPIKPQDGQWTFRFNHADARTVLVLVTINFGPPFSMSAELSAEMNKTQVGSLQEWLKHIHGLMKP